MCGHAVTLHPADEQTLPDVERLLVENDLPAADLRSDADRVFVASHEGTQVGAGALELYGRVGLLRSVVVAERARGQGHGAALCDRLEAIAADEGIETLYLLTTTATDFFAARGYTELDRGAVPPAIQETTQFAELCPASATCMRKRLE